MSYKKQSKFISVPFRMVILQKNLYFSIYSKNSKKVNYRELKKKKKEFYEKDDVERLTLDFFVVY